MWFARAHLPTIICASRRSPLHPAWLCVLGAYFLLVSFQEDFNQIIKLKQIEPALIGRFVCETHSSAKERGTVSSASVPARDLNTSPVLWRENIFL